MKRILVLSIQHTGTFFASKTLAAAYPDSHVRIGSIYEKHQNLGNTRYTTEGAIELSDFHPPKKEVPKNYIDKMVVSLLTEEEKKKEIVIGHEHFHKANSWILKALKETPSKCPIVVPVRDPILSLHSKIWREIEQHENKGGIGEKQRTNRLKKWIQLFKAILSIPKGHVFHLPIDASQSEREDTRIKLIQNMYTYCELPFNDSALQAAKDWQPTNRTYKLVVDEKEKTPDPRWEDFKQRYVAGDIEHTRAIMGLEFEALRKEKELIELMRRVGYRNVLWW